jgi:hypothetical protein
MQQRLLDGLAAPRDALPHQALASEGPPSLAEVLIRRSAEAREAKWENLLAEVQRSVEELVLATGAEDAAMSFTIHAEQYRGSIECECATAAEAVRKACRRIRAGATRL